MLKGVQSPERLLDETALFLHRRISDLPEAKQRMIEKLHDSDEPLRDRKVLVVDDDVRNIFALNSLLERHGMNVSPRPMAMTPSNYWTSIRTFRWSSPTS